MILEHHRRLMPANENDHSLPGVKGQWILCSECRPTEDDTDKYATVRIYAPGCRWGSNYRNPAALQSSDHWCPLDHLDHRPFTLPAASAPPALTKRKIVQLVTHPRSTAIYAVADDGTAWISSEEIPDWIEMAKLPDREVLND